MNKSMSRWAQVSLDLASFEVVRHAWETLMGVLREELLHTVFANEEEAAAVLAQARQPGQHSSLSATRPSITSMLSCRDPCHTTALPS